MKIKVKTNVRIPERDHVQGELELESGSTLGTALIALCRDTDLESLIAAGDDESGITVDDMWEIRINGRACYAFPKDLEIPLGHDDTIAVWLMPLGGG